MTKDELSEKRNQTIKTLNDIKAIFGLDELYIDEIEKENAELRADNDARKFAMAMSERVEKQLREENAELRKVAEFQQSSNMSRHFENKKLKEGLAVGSILNKGLNSLNNTLAEERDKYRNMVFDKDEQLTTAKEIIKKLKMLYFSPVVTKDDVKRQDEILAEVEQFLSEVEK